MLALVNEVTAGMALKYNKHYIGLAHDGIADNFVVFRPRKEHAIVDFRIPRSDEVTADQRLRRGGPGVREALWLLPPATDEQRRHGAPRAAARPHPASRQGPAIG